MGVLVREATQLCMYVWPEHLILQGSVSSASLESMVWPHALRHPEFDTNQLEHICRESTVTSISPTSGVLEGF